MASLKILATSAFEHIIVISSSQSPPMDLDSTIGTHKGIRAFTLVELIVVITILAILGTIGFLSLQGYSSSARDSTRISDLGNMAKTVELLMIERGSVPTPANATAYAGGSLMLQQGTINGSVVPRLSTSIKDPLTGAEYRYSTIANGRYYQIVWEFENTVAFNAFPAETAYAAWESKTNVLKGNYQADASLPSLFVISGYTDMASGWIFNPDICFALDKSTLNTFSSPAACAPKKLLSNKDQDSSLLGYWDMETLSWGLLKDLSGNGNSGSFSWGMSYATAQWAGQVGKGLTFNGSTDFVYLNNPSTLQPVNSFSLSLIFKPTTIGASMNILRKRSYGYWLSLNTDGTPGFGGFENISSNYSLKGKDAFLSGQSYMITGVYAWNEARLYVNGKLVSKTTTLWSNTAYYDVWGIAIWRDGNSSTSYTNGTIDEVKIYSRALSDGEIKQQSVIAGF